MVDTARGTAPDPAPAHTHRAPPMTWGDRVRFVLRGLGQTLITLGVVVLLFVVYEVYVTNYFAHEEQQHVRSALTHEWQTEQGDPLLPLPGQTTPKLPDGKGIANLYIPRLGNDYSFAIVQGTSDADLEKGPGHYPGTALPGQVGNFAVAGHRVGKGEPFLNLDHLQANDPVIVQTKTEWFIYRVLGKDGKLSDKGAYDVDLPGREVVDPSDGKVLLPYPDHPDTPGSMRLMTMTTCHPKFTAANRMILFAKLIKAIPASGLSMPPSVAAYYKS